MTGYISEGERCSRVEGEQYSLLQFRAGPDSAGISASNDRSSPAAAFDMQKRVSWRVSGGTTCSWGRNDVCE